MNICTQEDNKFCNFCPTVKRGWNFFTNQLHFRLAKYYWDIRSDDNNKIHYQNTKHDHKQ